MTRVRQSDRAFGLTFATLFAIIGGLGWTLFHVILYWTFIVSVVFLMIAMATPGMLLPLNRLWAAISERLGHFNNYVLLGLFFYLFMFPAALLMRLLGVDPMQRAINPEVVSYWTPVERHADAATFRDTF